MEGFEVTWVEECVPFCDVIITTTGNKDIITLDHMSKMKNNAIVGNIGHFDNEIQMEQLEKATTRMNIKPQCDKFIFPDGHGVIVLAQLELRKAYNDAGKDKTKSKYQNKVYLLPKELDEKVAKLHLGQLGAKLTELSAEQADYIGVKASGPYKPSTYRY